MQHFNSPAINSNVLACDDEDQEGEQSRDEAHFLCHQQFFQICTQVEENGTHE
jgi:hypothetical protein